MDQRDVPGSQDGRPGSISVKSAVATSSMQKSPPSLRSTVNPTPSSSSEYSGAGPRGEDGINAAGRDISPYETFVGERLTDHIKSFLDPELSTDRTGSLEASIRQAAVTIKYNAKWFNPTTLSTLILVALQSATASSASADLYAALDLLEKVGTYWKLPESTLPSISRFVAYAYYQGTRTHRLKRLMQAAWDVALQILRSHLGSQFISTLLDTLRDDFEITEAKLAFAYTTGTFMILSDNLMSKSSGIPTVKLAALLQSLIGHATRSDEVLCEYVMEMLIEVLGSEKHILEIDQDASWDILLEVVERYSFPPANRATIQRVLSRLQQWESHFEPRHVFVLYRLCIATDFPIFPRVQRELLSPWFRSQLQLSAAEELDGHVEKLCSSSKYISQLELIIRATFETIFEPAQEERDDLALQTTLQKLQTLMSSPSTTTSAQVTIGQEIVRAFNGCLQEHHQEWKLLPLYSTICSIVSRSPQAAEMLLRLRSDVKGSIFLIDASPKQALSSTLARQMVIDDAWSGLVRPWHASLVRILQNGSETWEVYNAVLTHLPSQLSNHRLFHDDISIIKELLAAVCHHLEAGTYMQPPPSSGLNRYYVITRLIQILTIIVSYHRNLEKKEILRTIALFNETAGSGDHVVSRYCIHALTVCCAEMPEIMSSYMDDVIDKMSKMVTQRFLAIHVLQFLGALSRLPDLHRNFAQHDYKKVFGVCFSFLLSTRGAKSTLERRRTPTSESSSAVHSEESLPEYVYALAHHLITFWYLSLKRQDRESLKPYIRSSLTYTDDHGKSVIEDQGLVTIDMMDRVDADSDCHEGQYGDEVEIEASHSNDAFTEIDGRIVERHRLAGLLLVTNKTALRTGRTLVFCRRPSGNSQRWIKNGQIARITVDCGECDYMDVLPGDTSGAYGQITIPSNLSPLGSSSIVELSEDDTMHRAIESFDRTSALDSHKAGVIYIGERQTTEERILRNISGSPDYKDFIHDLGTVEVLQGAKYNTQGLDRVDNMDGPHTIVWHSRVTELVYHVTTMMPNSDDAGETITRKKRHIGNDHVNIVFNNSGQRLDFTALYNIFPGAFTFVYIVIMPTARTSFVEARTENTDIRREERFYSVETVTRPDYPNVSPSADEKVVSGVSLAGYVRNLALNECIMSLMWASRSESADYPSSWRSRLHQLRRLADRYSAKQG